MYKYFHIILGFKNEDKIYFVILVVYSYFRKTEQTAIKIVKFEWLWAIIS